MRGRAKRSRSFTKAADFVTANDQSPVVSGAVFGTGGEGGVYTLEDGRHFSLDAAACSALPDGYPKWGFPER